MVVIKPILILYLSFNTFAIGARQLVVQEAQLITVSEPSSISWFTLNTTVFNSPVAGADITTRFAPAFICASAFALSVKNPVHSNTTSTWCCPHGICAGSFCAYIFISLPFTIIAFSVAFTSSLNRPCAESYFNKWANTAGLVRSLMATTSIPSLLKIWRYARRPILPKPLMATFTELILLGLKFLNAGRSYNNEGNKNVSDIDG